MTRFVTKVMPISYIDSKCYKETEKQQNLFNQSKNGPYHTTSYSDPWEGHTLTNTFWEKNL